MLKLLALFMMCCAMLCALILLPLLLVGGLLKVLFAALALPFRLIAAVAGGLLKVGLFLVVALAGVLLLAGGAILLPLLPFLVLGLVVWGLLRLLRPRRAARVIP